MPAPKGNKYAKDCKTSGRPRTFKTPEELLILFNEYKQDVKDNPITTEETTVSKFKNEVKTIKRHRPFTWDAFEIYVGNYSLRDYKTQYKEFSQVITHIDKEIRNNKFEGASAGVFNANIIARDLGLKEQSETKHEISEETIKFLEKLNDKIK